MPSFNCKHPTCATILKARGYCDKHQHLEQKWDDADKTYDREKRDPWSRKFYNSIEWILAKRWKLAHEPMCERCNRKLAEMAHHIRPVKEVRFTEPRLLYAEENLMSLCSSCHSYIEASQKGKRKSATG